MRVFDLLHDHQRLLAKAALVPLEPEEAVRLEALGRLLRGDARRPRDRRVMPRIRCAQPVQLATPTGFLAGTLRDLSGGGFRIEASLALAPGATLGVHLEDGSRSYVFPARVVWARGPLSGVALAGMPQRDGLGVRAA